MDLWFGHCFEKDLGRHYEKSHHASIGNGSCLNTFKNHALKSDLVVLKSKETLPPMAEATRTASN